MEVKMEVKMEVIEGSCSLFFFIFYGVRSLRQKWTIADATHLSYLTPYLTTSFTPYLTTYLTTSFTPYLTTSFTSYLTPET